MPAEALPRGSVSWLEPRPLLQKEAAGISLGAAGVLSKPFVCRSFVLLFLSECRCLYLLQNLAKSFIYMSNMWPRSCEAAKLVRCGKFGLVSRNLLQSQALRLAWLMHLSPPSGAEQCRCHCCFQHLESTIACCQTLVPCDYPLASFKLAHAMCAG